MKRLAGIIIFIASACVMPTIFAQNFGNLDKDFKYLLAKINKHTSLRNLYYFLSVKRELVKSYNRIKDTLTDEERKNAEALFAEVNDKLQEAHTQKNYNINVLYEIFVINKIFNNNDPLDQRLTKYGPIGRATVQATSPFIKDSLIGLQTLYHIFDDILDACNASMQICNPIAKKQLRLIRLYVIYTLASRTSSTTAQNINEEVQNSASL